MIVWARSSFFRCLKRAAGSALADSGLLAIGAAYLYLLFHHLLERFLYSLVSLLHFSVLACWSYGRPLIDALAPVATVMSSPCC